MTEPNWFHLLRQWDSALGIQDLTILCLAPSANFFLATVLSNKHKKKYKQQMSWFLLSIPLCFSFSLLPISAPGHEMNAVTYKLPPQRDMVRLTKFQPAQGLSGCGTAALLCHLFWAVLVDHWAESSLTRAFHMPYLQHSTSCVLFVRS